MNIVLPEKVSGIITTLQKAGYEAFAVGGCIRDSILGRVPDDWDITTSARPEAVKALFRRTVDTGIAHGTVTVMQGGEGFEVTTYRTDGDYRDGRHPSSVEFVTSLTEDLKRRDFTINAMAYNETQGMIDPFGGYMDLKRSMIRCVGEPTDRLSEDALRILRAIRFSAQLSFEIEPSTSAAMQRLAPTLSKISAERICQELTKLLVSPHPEKIRDAYELGITAVILPELDAAMPVPQQSRYHLYTVGEHTIRTMQAIRPDPILRFTMLLHDLGKPKTRTTDEYGGDHFRGHQELGAQMARDILRRLKTDNETIRQVTTLVRFHDWRYPAKAKNVRRAVFVLGEDLYPKYLEVMRADALGKSSYCQKEILEHLDLCKELFEEIRSKGQCVSLRSLAIGGKDLTGLGISPGPVIGRLLQAALEYVLEEPSRNRKEVLVEYIKKQLNNGGAV